MRTSVVDAIRQLAPTIEERATDIERGGTIPRDLLAQLRQAGCFRMMVPRFYGGLEMSLAETLEVIEVLSSLDASTGWCVMIAASNVLVLGLLPHATFEAIYDNGPDVICGGSHAPRGDAVPESGGYSISGQWPFASGSHHCDIFAVQAKVRHGGEYQLMDNGRPQMRLAICPSSALAIVETWDTLGLRGTASHDLRADSVFFADDWTCQLFGATSSISAPAFKLPSVAPLALFIAAVALGTATALLNDLCSISSKGRISAYGFEKVARSSLFQNSIGELDANLGAARALVYDHANRAWTKALSGESFSLIERARMRTASSYAVPVAVHVAGEAFRLAGSSALQNASVQRRLRDVQTLAQHAGVGTEFFKIAGAILLGEHTDVFRI